MLKLNYSAKIKITTRKTHKTGLFCLHLDNSNFPSKEIRIYDPPTDETVFKRIFYLYHGYTNK